MGDRTRVVIVSRLRWATRKPRYPTTLRVRRHEAKAPTSIRTGTNSRYLHGVRACFVRERVGRFLYASVPEENLLYRSLGHSASAAGGVPLPLALAKYA